MLQLLNHEALIAARNGRSERPTLCLSWELDPQTGKPVGRWIIDDAQPAAVRLAVAA
jgi:hypothetical protein